MRILRTGSRTRGLRGERGSAQVEFALVSILLMMQLIGIMELGRAVWMYGTLAHAAREGARYAIVRGAESKQYRGTGWEAAAADVQTYVRARAVGFSSAVNVTTTWDPDNVTACEPNNKPGCVVQVRATTSFSGMTAFMPNLTLRATSRMVISF